MRKDVVGQIEVQLANGNVDMMRIHAETRMQTLSALLQPFPVSGLQRYRLEEYNHHEVQTPDLRPKAWLVFNKIEKFSFSHLIRLSQAVYPSHFALLVRIAENAGYLSLAGHTVYKVLSVFGLDVFAQFAQQSGGPFLSYFWFLILFSKIMDVN